MEESSPTLVRKSSSNMEKLKITPQCKINELHDLIQGYLYSCDQKKVQNILPVLEMAKVQLDTKQKQKQRALSFKPSQKQLVMYHQTKNSLIEAIKVLGKKIEGSKNKLKEVRILKKQIQEQLSRNESLYMDLQQKCNGGKTKKSDLVLGKFPRISGFNYNLHHAGMSKRTTNSGASPLVNRPTSSTKNQEEKQNFYSSLNFRRIKQMQKLLDEITIECPSFKFEKMLSGDKKQSIAKKVFKNFSITEHFDKFMSQKNVLKFLFKIQKQ